MKFKMALILLIVIVTISGMSFADAPSPWAEESINGLKTLNILDATFFDGYAEFATRADFAYLGVRLYEQYTGKTAVIGEASFIDTKDEWVLKAKNIGVVAGYNDGAFKPNQLIKRDELAALFVNVFKSSDIDYKRSTGALFADDAYIAPWAKEAVYIARANGIVNGVGENRFDAKSNATLQQSLLMFNNGLNIKEPALVTTDVNENLNYDSINKTATFDIELSTYLGRNIKESYAELKRLYGDDIQLLEFPGSIYISIGGVSGQVIAFRSREISIEELWIGYNSNMNKPVDISMRRETINGYRVDQGVDAFLNSMGLTIADLNTQRSINSKFDVIGYAFEGEVKGRIEITKDKQKIFGISVFY